jgi:zinc transport system substrate-binding protein
MRDGLNMLKLSEHDHGDGHGHDDLDPHIWTSPVNVIKMCDTIENTLSEVDRNNSRFYSKNLELYATRLQALHSTIKEKLAKHAGASFMVYHPSWGYYAREYGLRQIAIESMGKEPGAATLTNLIKFAQDEGVSVIFTQKQFSDRAARTLAKSIGAKIVEIDPMANDYFENMEKVTNAISGALK